MPRGKPGTGPHARKRIQRVFAQPDAEYMRLALSEEETKVVFDTLQEALKKTFGTTEGFHLSNVTYRITEYVMLDKLGLPKKAPPAALQGHEKNGKQPRRRGRPRKATR